MMIDRPYSTEPFPAVPTRSDPGKVGTCVSCGLDFEQQDGGITAGNFCAPCWELRNMNVALATKKAKAADKWVKRIAAVAVALALTYWLFALVLF